MQKWFLHKIGIFFIVLMLVLFFNFLLLYSSPVDPVALQLAKTGVAPSKEVVNAIRVELGLDKPIIVQYFNWLKGVIAGDLGYSLSYGMKINDFIFPAILNTVLLTVSSIFTGLLFTFPLTLVAFIFRNRPLDYFIRFISFICQAMPTFWVGLLLIYVVSIKLRLLPVTLNSGLKALILPSIALGIWIAGFYIRRIRNALLEEFRKPYLTGATARGLHPYRIFKSYLFPNAMTGLISMFALTIGELLGGAVVAETIFSWEGMGLLLSRAIVFHDYPLLQICLLWGSLTYVSVNLIAEIIQYRLDSLRRMQGEL